MYTFTFTKEELTILSEALGELPFKKSAVLISNLQKQLDEQTKPKADVQS